jgi:hypothetical protein
VFKRGWANGVKVEKFDEVSLQGWLELEGKVGARVAAGLLLVTGPPGVHVKCEISVKAVQHQPIASLIPYYTLQLLPSEMICEAFNLREGSSVWLKLLIVIPPKQRGEIGKR